MHGMDLMTLHDLGQLLTQTILLRNWGLLPVLPQCTGRSKHLLIVSIDFASRGVSATSTGS